MQGDLFDDGIYYYDIESDIANLGSLRDTLQEGETFELEGVTWEIIERQDSNQCFAIQKVNNADNSGVWQRVKRFLILLVSGGKGSSFCC